MARKTYTNRFEEFKAALKEHGTYEVLDERNEGSEHIYKIDREVFDNLYESVKDFVDIKEWSDEVKQYRNGTHIVSWRRGNYSGHINLEFVVEDNSSEELEATMVAFTGMVIGTFKAVKSEQGFEVTTAKGKVLVFNSEGIQTNAKNAKFANRLQVA